MPSAFRLLTTPEILDAMFATVRAQYEDPDVDLNIGSLIRALLEAPALQDSAQYVQIGKLVDLFARGNSKGEDLDRRALDYGADVFSDMRRRKAQTSIAELVVGDGTVRRSSTLTVDVATASTSFNIVDATSWPTAGGAIIERGTLRQEEITFSRVGTLITLVPVGQSTVNPHPAGAAIETIAVQSKLAAGIAAGAGAFVLAPNTDGAWPAAGSVIFERSTVRREKRTFTRVGVNVTLGAVTTFAHAISTDVYLSTFGSDRAVAIGSVAVVPASETSTQVTFRTTEAGTLFDGDYGTSLISVESDAAGSQTRVGSNTITQWQSEPFANATVTNPNAAVRGRDREEDDTYNERISAFIQSLSRATALAVETLVAGQQDAFSNLFIAFAQTVEPVAPGESLLYITDGSTTFAMDSQVKTGRDVLIADARLNDARAHLNAYGPFSKVAAPAAEVTPRIFRSSDSGVATTTGVNYIENTGEAWTINQWVGFYVKSDDNQFYLIASNTAIRLVLTAGGVTPSLGTYSIFDFSVTPLIPGTDYAFNQSTGDLELVVPLALHDGLVAADDNALVTVGAYTYTRGLAAFAQRLVNGDRTAVDTYPGIKALGTACRVVVPTVITPTITIQVITASGLSDADLATTVQSVVQAYVNSLGIGVKVLLSEVIRLVKALNGVFDCKVLSPSANVTVSDGQIARMNASDVVVV